MTPNNPSELPRVLIVATIGFNSHMLANFNALSILIFPLCLKTITMSHPAIISDAAKRTLPKENHVLDQEVGNSIQASNGVYR